MKHIARGVLWFTVAFATAGLLGAAENAAPLSTSGIAQSMEIVGVHNAFRVTGRIFSGSQPEGDATFAALAKLGVKTVLSVDGSKPEVEAARKHGLRYIHLPFGYDGVPTNRMAELAKAATEGGPFYVHCHHGLHRGPAAVAIMCEATAGWTTNQAEAWLREAGTAADYPGLYRSAREFKAPSAAVLAAIKELPEITRPSSLVDAMVVIDERFDWLKKAQQAGWKTPPGHADISPEHEAMMLLEQFREIARTPDAAGRPADYRTKLAEAGQAAEGLHALLKKPAGQIALDAAFKRVTQSCAACHKPYRNQSGR